LLANTIATAAALIALILTFGPVSGAHFQSGRNAGRRLSRRISWREMPGYSVAQVVGGVLGVWVAHVMFALPVIQTSQHVRAGGAQVFSEFVVLGTWKSGAKIDAISGAIDTCDPQKPHP
jgi:glycerol uptake facilitator-like aquaporin